MKGSKYMFINKGVDSPSLSHSNKRERIQIHSHVQKGRRYKKSDDGVVCATPLPLLQAARRVSSSSDREGHSSDEPVTNSQSPIDGECTNSKIRRRPSDRQRHPEGDDPNIDPVLLELSKGSGSSNRSSPTHTIPVVPASAEANFDPFAATCVTVDGSIHSLLQYFLRVHHPNVWHVERAVRSDHTYAFRYDAMSVLQGCLHDEYNMYALLASMASYMTYLDGLPAVGIDGSFYIHKALQASQKYVQTQPPITARMIFNTFHLGCAEWYRYNVDAAYVHLKAAKAMADSIGGVRRLEGPLVELVLTGDAYVAAELGRKPLWSPDDLEARDDHPTAAYALKELEKLLSGKLRIGAGLLVSRQQTIIPAELRWTILDLAVVLAVLRSSREPSNGSPPPGSLHWVHTRSLAIRLRLLAMEPQDPRTDVVRLALLLWILLCFTVAGRKRSVKVIAPSLRQTLLVIPPADWDGLEEVRLWVLVIGCLSATLGSQDHAWFVGELDGRPPIARLDNARSLFDVLVASSEKFFYLESAQRDLVRGLADDLLSVRTTEKKEEEEEEEEGATIDKGKVVKANKHSPKPRRSPPSVPLWSSKKKS